MSLHEKVAKTLSKNYDIHVVFKGTQPKTDGKTIILPAMSEDVLSDPENIKLLRGYIDHEVGHVKHTEFFSHAKITAMGVNSERVFKVVNQLEDFRIERLQALEYFGTRKNLSEMANMMVKGMPEPQNPMAKIWTEARRQCCGFDIDAPDYSDDCKAAFGDDIFDRINALQSTADTIRLATDLIKSAQENEDAQEQDTGDADDEGDEDTGPEGDPKEGSGGSSEDDTEGSDDSEGDTTGEEEEGQEGSSNGPEDDSEDGDAESGSGGSEDGEDAGPDASEEPSDGPGDTEGDTPESDPEDDDGEIKVQDVQYKDHVGVMPEDIDDYADPSDVIRNRLTDLCTDSLNAGKYVPYTTANDIICRPFKTQRRINRPDPMQTYNAMLKKLGSLNVMRSKFTNLFKTDTKRAWLQGRESGKLNARALSSVATGNKRVFKEKYQKRDTDTAVSILIDWSGSMNGHVYHTDSKGRHHHGSKKIDLAMQSAVMFTELLTGLGIKHELISFTTKAPRWADFPETGRSLDDFGRLDTMIMYKLKGFDESLKQGDVKARIGNYQSAEMGSNADGESLQIAYDRIKHRPEKRKILLVLSDGEISFNGNSHIYKKHFHQVIAGINSEKLVELFAIGFDSNDVRRYYPKQHTIVKGKEAQNLPETLFATIKEFLLRKK